MKSIFISFCSFIVTLCLAISCFAQAFIPVFEDIPLMENLKHIEDDDVVFDNEEASYREAHLIADKKTNYKNIIRFYKKTLPQLGWTSSSESKSNILFERENGILEIRQINLKPLEISISLKNRS